jgi:AcrR family transcriptional regulator
MRAVARAAGTNTPAVYRRFKSRMELVRALAQRGQSDLSEVIRPCTCLQEIAEKALEFSLRNPEEYHLLVSRTATAATPGRPNVRLVSERAAKWLGGTPEDHTGLVYALWSMTSGASILLTTQAVPADKVPEFRAAFSAAVNTLVKNAQIIEGDRVPVGS